MGSRSSTSIIGHALAWLPLALAPLLVWVAASHRWPPWAVMWTMAVVALLACKWITWSASSLPASPRSRRAAYWLAWPGLNPAAFLRISRVSPAATPTAAECLWALAKLLIGAGLFWAAARLVPADRELVIGWIGLIGLALMLHFGAIHLLSCLWRSAGVDALPVMNSPLASASLSDFWGARWNTAFRDLAHRHVYRPLLGRLGPRGATVAVFAFSGIVHDLVISLSAGGGYGGPTAYFAIQACGLLGERSKAGRSLGLGGGFRGWLFTAVVVTAPAGLLFHRPFIHEVVLPFMRAAGASRNNVAQ